eukprot:CAMPEP_0184742808 /NCGR_PEP_ID=MMETSP0315-20130426/5771_1 /TAXON_ID=101924 /ORGANISM="Rhodosorus marinus, Strain UTEX LB 2760" /LENGTH=146 /DNA_ID=CAMNT_0027213835 /DNA_START=53 /DNA_END=490 /DNA_ORIENTATION=-
MSSGALSAVGTARLSFTSDSSALVAGTFVVCFEATASTSRTLEVDPDLEIFGRLLLMNALIELFLVRIPSPAVGAPVDGPVFFLLRSILDTSAASSTGAFASAGTILVGPEALGCAEGLSLELTFEFPRLRPKAISCSASFAPSSS